MTTTRGQVGAYLNDRTNIGKLTPRTAAHMRGTLYAFTDHMPVHPEKIRRRDILRWLRTTTHLSAGTRRLYWTRAKGFTDWLLRRGVLRKDPFLDVPAPKVPRAVHRSLEPDQIRALLAACVTPRDRVVVLLGVHTGLRRAELAALEIGDVSLAARTVMVRSGKGGHQRLLPLSEEAARAVAYYVAGAGLASGPLLRRLTDPQAGVAPGTVSRIFDGVARRAGVKMRAWDGVAAHSMRHTAASAWYDASGDVLAVRDLLGHANLVTTQRYVRGMDVERLRSAVEGRRYLGGAA